MNFFHSKVANASILINQSLAMDVGETSSHVFVVHCVEVVGCLCGESIWQIECCPSKFNIQCSALQKDTKHYYKIKIISKQIDCGILAPCYVGD
jgi:hypothetical protein